MKRILFLAIFLFIFQGLAFAAPVTIADPGGQSELTVEQGAIRGPISKAVKHQLGNGQFYTGACRIQSVTVYGDTAGDMVAIYDYSASIRSGSDVAEGDIRDLEFELAIAANTSTPPSWNLSGAPLAFGIFILTNDDTNVRFSIVFDY